MQELSIKLNPSPIDCSTQELSKLLISNIAKLPEQVREALNSGQSVDFEISATFKEAPKPAPKTAPDSLFGITDGITFEKSIRVDATSAEQLTEKIQALAIMDSLEALTLFATKDFTSNDRESFKYNEQNLPAILVLCRLKSFSDPCEYHLYDGELLNMKRPGNAQAVRKLLDSFKDNPKVSMYIAPTLLTGVLPVSHAVQYLEINLTTRRKFESSNRKDFLSLLTSLPDGHKPPSKS